ncbi:MAG: pilin [Candidatus Magasanikbacteria bacterium]|jgi:hypothetical protein
MRFKIFIIIGAIFSLFLFCPVQAADYGLKATVDATGGSLPTSIKGAKTIPELAGIIVNAGLSLVGIIFFLLMLYAGINWMKAMGNTEEVTKAKDMIIQAVIGLVIVMAAYAATNFVFTSLGASGGGGGPSGGGTTITDGTACNGPSGETGYKWNCRGGAGVKSCSSDVAKCDSPCRFGDSKSTCMEKSVCAANITWTDGGTSKCPGSTGAVCCKTDVTQDK